jgi:hypothetical protein
MGGCHNANGAGMKSYIYRTEKYITLLRIKCMKRVPLLFCCLLLLYQAFAANEDSLVYVRLSLPKITITASKDLLLTISIKSNTNKKIVIQKYISVGKIQDSSGFISLQLQKMEGQTYKDVKPHGDGDYFAPYDKTDTLQSGEQRDITDNISLITIPYKGKYRIRAVCFFSVYNEMKDVYSDWLYFNCEKPIYPGVIKSY